MPGALRPPGRAPTAPDAPGVPPERPRAGPGAARLVEVVDRLAAGPIDEVAQDEAHVTYAAKITRADSPIDWRAPARALHDLSPIQIPDPTDPN